MGIFTRFRDIVSSNINAMLDKAEDPEKLIRLMIQEMEETLIELKASCAKAMADGARVGRALDAASAKSNLWNDKATLAVAKGREDLAREALLERRVHDEKTESLRGELAEIEGLVESCREDMGMLEEKLAAAKERRRTLVLRHRHAGGKKRARTELSRVQSMDTMLRFEQFENRIERMEAEAELAGPWAGGGNGPAGGRDASLHDRFSALEVDEDIEKELAALKARAADVGQSSPESSAAEAAEAPGPAADKTEKKTAKKA
jgi:phage shock protein A